MRRIGFLFSCLLVFSAIAHPASNSQNIRLIHLRSKIFGNQRTLRVLLPAEYDRSADSRFPVFYFNDGYAVFHYWKLTRTIQELTKRKKLPAMIVVGIDNAGEKDRAAEYLPFADESNSEVKPRGDKYPDFLTEEVIPLIDKTFRTKSGSENRGLGGASYGSYIALYTVIHKPELFGKLLLESTPLFISDFQILKETENAKRLPSRISIGVGTKETDDEDVNARVGTNAKRLESAILKAMPSAKVRVFVQEGGQHNSEAWAERLPGALEFLFANEN